jgi:hypothetical protein
MAEFIKSILLVVCNKLAMFMWRVSVYDTFTLLC